jgi:hypothetical protein
MNKSDFKASSYMYELRCKYEIKLNYCNLFFDHIFSTNKLEEKLLDEEKITYLIVNNFILNILMKLF